MENTLYAKCERLALFYVDFHFRDEYKNFFSLANDGLVAAISCYNGSTQLTQRGAQRVEYAWSQLCEGLGIDTDKEFTDYEDFISYIGHDEYLVD